MKFVQLAVLQLARVCQLLKAARLLVRRAVPVMKGTSLVAISVCPSQSAAAHTMTATTVSAKYFTPTVSVRRSASVNRMERY